MTASTGFPADITAALVAAVLVCAGVLTLRWSWLSRGSRRIVTLAGWLVITAGIGILVHSMGAEVGITYGLLLLGIAGYAAVLLTIELRGRKSRAGLTAALEPEDRRINWSRTVAKSLLAIVLAGIAAIGVGVAFAVAMPLETHDRVVIGGLLVPILWGGGMAWTLADAKLLRATIILMIVSAIGYGIAFLPKVL